MAQLIISQVARQIQLRPSAIRYYERIGLLPPAVRVGGQRRYDFAVLYRLAIIQRARQLGFTLDEIRSLFFGFGNVTRASARWRRLAQKKLLELETLLEGISAVRKLLRKLMTNCRCDTFDQCGKRIFGNMNQGLQVASLARNQSKNLIRSRSNQKGRREQTLHSPLGKV